MISETSQDAFSVEVAANEPVDSKFVIISETEHRGPIADWTVGQISTHNFSQATTSAAPGD
jgi:hypothetical protein